MQNNNSSSSSSNNNDNNNNSNNINQSNMMQATLTTPIVTQRRMSRRLAQRYNSVGAQLTPNRVIVPPPPSVPEEEAQEYIKVNTKTRREIQTQAGGYLPATGPKAGGLGGYAAAGAKRGPRKTRSQSHTAIHNQLLKTKGARK